MSDPETFEEWADRVAPEFDQWASLITPRAAYLAGQRSREGETLADRQLAEERRYLADYKERTRTEVDALRAELAAATKRAEEVDRLRSRVSELEAQAERLTGIIEQGSDLLGRDPEENWFACIGRIMGDLRRLRAGQPERLRPSSVLRETGEVLGRREGEDYPEAARRVARGRDEERARNKRLAEENARLREILRMESETCSDPETRSRLCALLWKWEAAGE